MTSAFDANEPPSPWSIAVVDDDPVVLQAISRMLEVCGHTVLSYASARAFLRSLEHAQPEVLLLDLRMPDVDGAALQTMMRQLGHQIPIIFLSGHGDVATSVRALRQGAIDFLEKPCDEQTLLAALARGVRAARRERSARETLDQLAVRWHTLTRREREVCGWVVTGRLNKQIAAALGTAEKTIKVHRARVMTKMGAASVADLVRIFDLLSAAGRLDAAGPSNEHMLKPPSAGVARAGGPAPPALHPPSRAEDRA
jgi:FixJ family two-component response regulator